jgi:hypothetical protein
MKRFHNYLAYGHIKPPTEEEKQEEPQADPFDLAEKKLQAIA